MNACIPAEFGGALEQRRGWLLGLARRILGKEAGDDVPVDLVGEAFIRAIEHRERIAHHKLGSWLYQVVMNLAIDWRRRHKRQHLDQDRSADELPATEGLCSSRFDSPRALLMHIEEVHQLQEAMAALSDDHREIIELRILRDLSVNETAALLDLPIGTVGSRLHHALRNMRAYLTLQDRPRRSMH